MISWSGLVVVALVGPGEISAETFRQVFDATQQVSVTHSDPGATVTQLAILHQQLDATIGLTGLERTRMRRSLRSRLIKRLDLLVRIRNRPRDLRAGRTGHSGGAPGPVENLIRLIVTTIAPESWQVNGGTGTITYYPIRPALVIRASGETHDEIAALLRALEQ